MPLDARCHVHRVSDHGVAHQLLRPDIPDDGLAGVHPDRQAELRTWTAPPFGLEVAERRLHLDRGLDGIDGVVAKADRSAVEGHQAVADVLVESAPVLTDELRESPE